jgi:hypothetical protein
VKGWAREEGKERVGSLVVKIANERKLLLQIFWYEKKL